MTRGKKRKNIRAIAFISLFFTFFLKYNCIGKVLVLSIVRKKTLSKMREYFRNLTNKLILLKLNPGIDEFIEDSRRIRMRFYNVSCLLST